VAQCAARHDEADVGSSVLMDLRRSSISTIPRPGRISLSTRRSCARCSTSNQTLLLHGRLWDDGLIEPADTRNVLGLCPAIGAMEPPVTGPRPSAGCRTYHLALSELTRPIRSVLIIIARIALRIATADGSASAPSPSIPP
jgi:hypothetical protein